MKGKSLVTAVVLTCTVSTVPAMAQSIRADGNIETDGQLVSNVATSTAPLVVSSTTMVPNLNADLLDGLDASALALDANLQALEALLVDKSGLLDCLEGLFDGRLMTETENNGSLGTADPICFGQASGVANTGPDFFSQPEVSEGDLIFAYVDALGDSVLRVFSNDGTFLEVDNNNGVGFDSVIAGAVVPVGQSGEVFYRVNEFGLDDQLIYRLYEVVTSATQNECEPNESAAEACLLIDQPVVNALILSGVDYYTFFAPAFARIVVMVDDDPDNDLSLTDTDIEIIDIDGTTSLGSGDNDSGADGNAVVVSTRFAGKHYLRVTNGNPSGDTDYRFVVRVYPGQG